MNRRRSRADQARIQSEVAEAIAKPRGEPMPPASPIGFAALGVTVVAKPLLCRACQHRWLENILSHVAVEVWAKHVRSLYCPNCKAGYKNLAFIQEEVGAKEQHG